MRKFKISNNIQETNVTNLIESYFGSISLTEDNKYIVENPTHEVIEEIEIKIKPENSELFLNITEKDLDKIQDENLLSTVPDVMQAKNKFLKNLTGTTVDDRKNMWREDVLPTDEAEIRAN